MHSASERGSATPWTAVWRRAVDAIAILFMQAYMVARTRALSSPSPTVRLLGDRDERANELALLARESDVLRRRLGSIPTHRRPQVRPEDRFEVIQIMRLRDWSADEAAARFVLHPNTIQGWLKQFRGRRDPEGFFGGPPFNKMSGAVRWLVHETRRLCPEPEFGTRSIAMQIVRAGIRLSRSSVQRILREEKPAPPVARKEEPSAVPDVVPHGILRPTAPNRTWHLDLTTFHILWLRFHVAALLDGFSRRLLALRVHRKTPTTAGMLRLVLRAVRDCGAPRFLVTDHGCQFGGEFKSTLAQRGVAVVQGRVRRPQFNGRVERFFKTLKLWQRATLLFWKAASIHRRLDSWAIWYNTMRPMWALGGRTPDEVWRGETLPDPTACRERDPVHPVFHVVRRHHAGDLRLPILEIGVSGHTKRVA